MKKILYAMAVLCVAVSCNLDFEPTDSGSGDKLLKSASTAVTIEDGIYRSMWTAGWSTSGNTHQCFGISAYNIALEAMGDDFVMQNMGNGWFWYDHVYNVKSYYESSAFRPYDVWYANYTWISNVNYILDAIPAMEGTEEDVALVAGEAYAIRALAYLNLATWFARAPYNARENRYRWSDPGVPVYVHGTDKNFQGKPRENLETVYARIKDDIDNAIENLEKGRNSSLSGGAKSHINLYTALGIKSRWALAVGEWQEAFDAAVRVIDEGGYSVGGQAELMGGMNSLEASNVMWGAGIETLEQSGGYAGFFTHMDNVDGAYAQSAPKLISASLYRQISSTDIRAAWWDPSNRESPYISNKFAFRNVTSWLGDYIYMRVEEMYFTAAEAALRLDDPDSAVKYMNEVMSKRDPYYDASRYSQSLNLGATTNSWVGSLLENILVEKRIELWGEFGRLFDVRRLGQGIDRTASDGFTEDCLSMMSRNGINLADPDTYDWVMTIPQDEINANDNINEEDQNP